MILTLEALGKYVKYAMVSAFTELWLMGQYV